MSGARLVVVSAVLLAFAPSLAVSSPIDVVHPGGVPTAADTLDYPVIRSPSLRSLRALSPFIAAGEDSAARALTRAARAADSTLGVSPAPSSAAPAAPQTAAIDFAGSKSISVEMGRGRDASLHQTLDLTVRGKVAGDIEVSAALSDQELPFEPDGSTRDLQDLDRLLLSIRAPQGEVTMGDFRLDGGPGEFSRVTRQLQGVRGQARVAGTQWSVAAASAKGERGSIEIRGEEGKQGPYDLTARVTGELPTGVVAGSEVVWLDGVRLKRGSDQDYVIDYGEGTVTFTTRHPITAESRIAFDFERASTSFRRSLYAAFTQGGGSAGSWHATYLKDGDDPKSPLEVTLTPEDIQVLGSLGDSAAASSGARYVGPGKGDYAWDQSDPLNPQWVHLGAGRGDYLVEFTSVGPGRGAYADTTSTDGTRFYRYMGRTFGSYTPGRSLPSPDEHRLLDLGGSVKLGPALELEAEGARSGLDRNELSSLDDGDNGGNAVRVGAQLHPGPLSIGGRSLGTLRFSGTLRARDSRFTPMDRVDDAFESDRWNQAAAASGAETRGELGLTYDPASFLTFRAEGGKRALEGGSRATRGALAAEWRGAVAGGVHWEGSRNELGTAAGSRSRLSFDFGRDRGPVTPRVRFLDERIASQEGDSIPDRRSREWSVGLGVAPVSVVSLRASYADRLDRRGDVTVGLQDTRGSTWQAGLTARSRAALSLDAGWTRRRVGGAGATGSGSTDLAQLTLLAGAPGSAFASEIRYDATQLREPEVVRQVVAVDSGTGSYDAFANPTYRGDYQLVTSTGLPESHTRANVQLRVDAYPGRTAKAATAPRSFWRAWGFSTFLRVETLTSLPLGNPARAIDPTAYLDPEATLRGNASARQTVDFAPRGARYDLHGEVGLRRERQGDFENLRMVQDGFDTQLRIRNPVAAGLRLTSTFSWDGTEDRAYRTDAPDRFATTLRGRGVDLELARALGPAWSVSLLGRGRSDRDLTRGGRQETVAAGPSARCAAGGKLRLDGRALWAHTTRSGVYQPTAFFVPLYLGNHVDYDLIGDYRIRDQVSLNLSWNGQVASRRSAAYTGRLELRSYF